jgi:hypothetical protein
MKPTIALLYVFSLVFCSCGKRTDLSKFDRTKSSLVHFQLRIEMC